MRTVIVLCILLIALPVWAGTFRDDFDDNNLDGWKIASGGGQIEVRDGEAVITDWDPGIASFMIFNNEQEVRDFELSVDAQMARKIDDKTWDYIAIMSRATDVVGVWMSIQVNGNIPLILLTSPQHGLQEFGRKDAHFPFEMGRWYHIQVEMGGSKLTVTIDGKFVAENEWPGHPMLSERGWVGIGAGGSEVHFDNLVITGNEVPDAGPSGFAVNSAGKLATTWGEIRRGR